MIKMEIINFIKNLIFKSYIDEITDLKNQIEVLSYNNTILSNNVSQLESDLKCSNESLNNMVDENIILNKEIVDLNNKLENQTSTKIDYSLSEFTVIPNIAYKNKRKDDTIVFLNQTITPNSFEIEHLRQTLNLQEATHNNFIKFGNFIAKNINWVDETIDNYAYPEEVLSIIRSLKTIVNDDCDTVTDIFVSMFPENSCKIMGYYISDLGNKVGHAFVRFINENGKSMYMELTGLQCSTFEIDNTQYIPYIAITQNKTYQIKSGLKFGIEPTYSWYKNRT